MGFDPTIFGLQDRRLTTWPPCHACQDFCAITFFVFLFHSIFALLTVVERENYKKGRKIGGMFVVLILLSPKHTLVEYEVNDLPFHKLNSMPINLTK